MLAHSSFLSRKTPDVSDGSLRLGVIDRSLKMIAGDISKGKENVKVPVVNELNDEKPNEFTVIITECVISIESIPRVHVRSQLHADCVECSAAALD